MEFSKAAESDGSLRGIIDNEGMNEAGGGSVHIQEPIQRAIPFPDENAFFAPVGVG
jgi:hypothetical protein